MLDGPVLMLLFFFSFFFSLTWIGSPQVLFKSCYSFLKDFFLCFYLLSTCWPVNAFDFFYKSSFSFSFLLLALFLLVFFCCKFGTQELFYLTCTIFSRFFVWYLVFNCKFITYVFFDMLLWWMHAFFKFVLPYLFVLLHRQIQIRGLELQCLVEKTTPTSRVETHPLLFLILSLIALLMVC